MNFPEQCRSGVLEATGHLGKARVDQAIEWFLEARDASRQIFVCGNGGSATTASHFVCDMVKGAS